MHVCLRDGGRQPDAPIDRRRRTFRYSVWRRFAFLDTLVLLALGYCILSAGVRLRQLSWLNPWIVVIALLGVALAVAGEIARIRLYRQEPLEFVLHDGLLNVRWRTQTREYDLAEVEVRKAERPAGTLHRAVRVSAGSESFLVLSDLIGFGELVSILRHEVGA